MAVRLVDGSEFLHIPKTGGTWVEHVLSSIGLVDRHIGHKHSDFDRNLYANRLGATRALATTVLELGVSRVMKGLKPDWYDEARGNIPRKRFCFVRHPLAWYESWWRYMRGRGWNTWGEVNSANKWHPSAILNGLGSDDFNEFVANVLRVRPGYVSELYYSFVKPGVQFIGRTESLASDLVVILEKLGLSFDRQAVLAAPKVNESAPVKQAVEWDETLRELVIKTELPALAHFGYLSDEERKRYSVDQRFMPTNPHLLV